MAVYKINWKQAWSVVLVFWIQFMFFPGVMFQFKYTFIDDFSWFVIVVVTYNSVGDLVGRLLAGCFDLFSKKVLLPAVIVRGIIFFVLYFLTWLGTV